MSPLLAARIYKISYGVFLSQNEVGGAQQWQPWLIPSNKLLICFPAIKNIQIKTTINFRNVWANNESNSNIFLKKLIYKFYVVNTTPGVNAVCYHSNHYLTLDLFNITLFDIITIIVFQTSTLQVRASIWVEPRA